MGKTPGFRLFAAARHRPVETPLFGGLMTRLIAREDVTVIQVTNPRPRPLQFLPHREGCSYTVDHASAVPGERGRLLS